MDSKCSTRSAVVLVLSSVYRRWVRREGARAFLLRGVKGPRGRGGAERATRKHRPAAPGAQAARKAHVRRLRAVTR